MAKQWEIFWYFGSPWAGGVCDDGPEGILGPFPGLQEAKERLQAWAKSQQCPTELARDGQSADCFNYNGSLTGRARIRAVEEPEEDDPPRRCRFCRGDETAYACECI